MGRLKCIRTSQYELKCDMCNNVEILEGNPHIPGNWKEVEIISTSVATGMHEKRINLYICNVCGCSDITGLSKRVLNYFSGVFK